MDSNAVFASAIASCAFGTSIVVCVPIAKALLAISVPFAFRSLGIGLGAVVFVCAFFITLPAPGYMADKIPPRAAESNPYTFKEALGDARFWFMCAPLFFLAVPYSIINTLVQTIGAERGISSGILTATSMIIGVASAVSRFVVPTLSDKLGRAKSILVMTLLMMLCSILMIFVKGLAYPVVVFFIAFAYSGPAGVYPAMSGDAFGMKNTGTIFGCAFLCVGIATLFTTWFVGVLTRNSTSYTTCFIVAAAFCLVPAVCLAIYDKVGAKLDKKRAEKLANN